MLERLARTALLLLLIGCGKGHGEDMGMEGPPDLTAGQTDLRMAAADLRGGMPDLLAGTPDLLPPADLLSPPHDLPPPPPDLPPPPPDLPPPADMLPPPADMAMPMSDMASMNDMSMGDMAMSMSDMASTSDMAKPGSDGGTGGHIGDPCSDTPDCRSGPGPVCWKTTVLDQMGAPKTPGGYCSSTCTMDADCGAGNSCVDFGMAGQFCLRGCGDATTCRHPGYACLFYGMAGLCYPDDIYDCNPKAPMGLCTESGTMKAGGCLRQAFEDKGTCNAVCDVGAGTCPMLGGTSRQCVFYDATKDGFMDPFKGLFCVASPAMPKMAGDPCVYLNDCADGYQCDSMGGVCHQLCKKGGAPACPGMAMCADAFMTAADGPGICR